MEEIFIPETIYELTWYNLDCEVPLAFPFREMFPCSETSAKLEELPSGLVLPGNLENKIRYDANKKLLIFKGVMSKEIKDRLLTLSADDSYKQAVETLFYQSLCPEITIDNMEKSPHFIIVEGWERTHRLIKRHPLIKLVGIVRPGESYYTDEFTAFADLEKLPEDIQPKAKCGDEIVFLDNQEVSVGYDSGRLFCEGSMGEAEKEELLNLSQDALYQEAIKKLQKSPEEFKKEKLASINGELERTVEYLLFTLRLLKSSRIWMRHVFNFIYSGFLSTNIPLKPYKLKNEDIELIHKLYRTTGYFLAAVREYLEGEQDKIQRPIRGYFYLIGISEIKHNIDLALSYYMRAHDEPFSRGDLSLIQLFVALETLFVQKGDEQSIKYKLRNRVATLLGEDWNGQEHIRKILKKLYELRGDIVHGSEMPNPDITHDLLQELFEYTRLSILYFIGLASREKKDIIDILDSTRDDKNIRELRKEIWGYYPPELHKVLQFNGE